MYSYESYWICKWKVSSPSRSWSNFCTMQDENSIVIYCTWYLCNVSEEPNCTKLFSMINIYRTIFAIILLVALGSTIYDIMAKINEFQPNKLYIAFSLYTNGQKLFDVTKSKSPNSINCLHGIRSLSILWIIFGHRCLNHLVKLKIIFKHFFVIV